MGTTTRTDWFDSIAPAVIEQAWQAYCDALEEDSNSEHTRSEFERYYRGTYASIERYMLDVYIPLDALERDVPWTEDYDSAYEMAEFVSASGWFWWTTEDDGTVHVFETP